MQLAWEGIIQHGFIRLFREGNALLRESSNAYRAFQTKGKASMNDPEAGNELHIFKEGKKEFTVVKEEV